MKEFEEIIARKVRPIHPGEVIEDILEELEISQTKFAEILGVSYSTLNDIIQVKKQITVDLSIRLGKALGNGPQLWLNLQQKVELWDALQNPEEYNKVMTVV
ncbi:HigA family addiction module antitoxin [Oscillatoria sp. FACHB-1406]|uniref:HigA family addiction module antitoxin n=1 Tax=Oscillatoria sp. FACHB-1406 TaxID=2692846 RepID=UPI001687F383|nr:HigA family addiction module antitoxin [Oscillatoria sp. FACHB-1406]MBD2576826.1 HigA family addiction module antidote protein [Oscillatoria sp. FACHB-1406]